MRKNRTFKFLITIKIKERVIRVNAIRRINSI